MSVEDTATKSGAEFLIVSAPPCEPVPLLRARSCDDRFES